MHVHSHQEGQSGHHGHHYAGLGEAATGILAASILATLLLVVVEFAAGYAGRSIALVSDAIHNLTDAPTLVISWLAIRWAMRPATPQKTYGYHRAGILAAFVNATVLALAALVLIGESLLRLRHPEAVQTGWMLWVSLLALAINGGITLAVVRGRDDLNVRTVWIHNLGDALSNFAILVGALLIRWSGGLLWLDAAIGIGIGVDGAVVRRGNSERKRAHSSRRTSARNGFAAGCASATDNRGRRGSARHSHLDSGSRA